VKIFFSQIYIQEGITFPFTHNFQKYLSDEITSLVECSTEFNKTYGPDWEIIFRISAKKDIDETEIKGPTLFRKDKDIEYTIFLPYVKIMNESDIYKAALNTILLSVREVLDSLGIVTTKLINSTDQIVNEICSNKEMVKYG